MFQIISYLETFCIIVNLFPEIILVNDLLEVSQQASATTIQNAISCTNTVLRPRCNYIPDPRESPNL